MRRSWIRNVWMVFAGLVFIGCDTGSDWEGKYVSQATDVAAVTLTLQSDGKGLWMVDQESTSVRWKKREGALWLHVKTGGVLIARPLENENGLSVALPGGGSILLKKVSD